jgi:hypothetical protein
VTSSISYLRYLSWIPDPAYFQSGSGILIKELKFIIKRPIPDPDPVFFELIPDPESSGQKGTISVTLVKRTFYNFCSIPTGGNEYITLQTLMRCHTSKLWRIGGRPFAANSSFRSLKNL